MSPWSPPVVVLLGGLLVGLLGVSPCWGFNLEPREAQVYDYPGASTQGREPYFGFAVALQKRQSDESAWLVVGAPRANSTSYLPDRITEPGAVFKCDLGSRECEELFIDNTGNGISNPYTDHASQDLKNAGWLGGTLDSQPIEDGGRQATAMCAPRWRNQYFSTTYLMNGVCYWLNSSLPNVNAHKRMPLVQSSKQTLHVNGRDMFFYSHGQVGFSVHFPDDPSEMILGAPGVFNWQGTVVRFKDRGPPITGEISRRRRQTPQNEFLMFGADLVPNPIYTADIKDFDLMGYAVTSGRYIQKDQLLYAAGAPRGADSFGKVIIFSFPSIDSFTLGVVEQWQGDQLGSNFGAALTSADLNGDGLSDLVVGAPMFSQKDLPDMGTVRVFLSSVDQSPLLSSTALHGSRVSYARFGTSLTSLGDLNADGYQDIAVGAPYEEGGAVYIYLGSGGELKASYSQRIAPDDFSTPLTGFGMALSRGIDIDDNQYPDLAIGSFLSGHAVVVKSRPVANLTGTITTHPSAITIEDKSFQMTACIQYGGYRVSRTITIKGNLNLDPQASRAHFSNSKLPTLSFGDTLTRGEPHCNTYTVEIKDVVINPREPISLRMDYELVDVPDRPLISQPIVDPNLGSGVTSRVSIVTGCEGDGNDICSTDIRLEAGLLSYSPDQQLVIGVDNKPVLRVSVSNLGEPAFLPNITVKVGSPLALFMPSSHECFFPEQGKRNTMVCRLSNPIATDKEDSVDVTIDMSQLRDRSSSLNVSVEAGAEGVEVQPSDNARTMAIQLQAQASVKIHGYSHEEQVRYSLDEMGNINSTTNITVFHAFTLVKEGPTPVEQVQLIIDIPVRIKGDSKAFVHVYSPSTNFLGQPIQCQLNGAHFIVDSNAIDGGSSAQPLIAVNKSSTEPPTNIMGSTRAKRSTASETRTAPVVQNVANFNCTDGVVECANLRCMVGPWPENTITAEISIKLAIELLALGDQMTNFVGAVLKSKATATITSLNSDLHLTGDKSASLYVTTQIQPDHLMGSGVPWWIILLAVLGGLLLLGLLAYGLHKAGFFQRKERDEMKAQQARVEPNDQGGYGSANTGLVGD